ncbi:Multicopper oxidase with three cupredoxin domains (includes cell division protein FtsP and spore coat protein CotA) [Nonomuraea solani]|uniref:Multicopper oxidase with three cupredoxin domains (Includes cell division protein FtsP and spore coat protein CotA) n=1 Tax=Nonomuraea solani TaxID=1144553 RepID=A0A1H5UUF9_9ACTN|nr:multicopper oxidase domain-containing protein [Nonomuraea solani]SEF78584.1 Multicopper oxidase with three cupredoxin domains (includes cell division protein FtsP and spore coat protein CotA) [Nonomuraea solani]
MRRRAFLGALAGAGLAVAGCREVAGQLLSSRLPLPRLFTVPLPIPEVARPVRPGRYEVTQRVAKAEIVPGTRTEVWGYGGTFPGPTFELRRGSAATIAVRNELPVPTSTHLHGGVNPPDSDGYPTDLVVPPGHHAHHGGHPGEVLHQGVKDYHYPVDQRAATLWYHDHRMDFTAPQVWRGLAGFALVRDAEEDALPLPGGERELPLLICDRAFEEDGSFRYPAAHDGAYMEGVEGDVILVNGAPWPVAEVSATRHRLRLLNASNARRYRLRLAPGGRFTQIGSDSGLLAAPVAHEEIPISPGERYDVVVDFSAYPVGSAVTLVDALSEGPVMRFVVARRAADDSAVPARLSRPPDRPPAVATRRFDFRRTEDVWTINGHPYRPGVPLARPRLGTAEVWRLTSDFHHPVHVHLAHFQVLARNGKPPAATDAGWKDTVDVRPYEVVDVLARFDGHRGRYMLHCHNLEHEDMAMMADFEVI